MQIITKFKAKDGREFTDATRCAQHEDLCDDVAAVVAVLPALPPDDGCRFANGHGYIQHDPKVLADVRLALLRLAKQTYADETLVKWADQSIANPNVHPSWVARLLSDYDSPISNGWCRLLCTDANGREWGQPYYANNPDQGEAFCVNKPTIARIDGEGSSSLD